MGATLLFPCCVPEALVYAEEAARRGEPVIAASSLTFDETAPRFSKWLPLPNVYAEDFPRRLRELVDAHGVERVFAPVSAAHWMLERLVARGEISIEVLGEMPVRRHAREHGELLVRAEARRREVFAHSDHLSSLSTLEVAAALRAATAVFGESNETKIAALLGIFADAPMGDVVEIGVLTGRSALVLEMMARRHGTGSVLVIDPWAYAHSVQRESPEDLQRMVDVWDANVPYETFLIQLLPIARRGGFNYLRMTGTEAHAAWMRDGAVRSAEFGEAAYAGRIAVLHIDGNHDYAAVKEDVDVWVPHIAAGGWLVLDDYLWLHGDGPRRVGDALLASNADRIARAFVCGGALFIKFGCER